MYGPSWLNAIVDSYGDNYTGFQGMNREDIIAYVKKEEAKRKRQELEQERINREVAKDRMQRDIEHLREMAKKSEEEIISRRRAYLAKQNQNPDFNLGVYNPWNTPAPVDPYSSGIYYRRNGTVILPTNKPTWSKTWDHAKTEADHQAIKRMLTRRHNSWTGKIMERPPPAAAAASPPPAPSRLGKIRNFLKKYSPSRGTKIHPAPAGGGKGSKRCNGKRNKTNNNKNKKSSSRRHKKCKYRRTIKK